MKTEELLDIANSLSNDDLCTLINMVSDRLFVFYGVHDNMQQMSDVTFACMNGASVQINTESAQQEDAFSDEPLDCCKENLKSVECH
jgi:hypothetical protein|tara:strand:- start:251 stop:511 length:261 start_codon:yes stop_codon:yes gene_type:complete